MPYVERKLGQVVGKYAQKQAGYAEEWLDDGHPDLSVESPEELAQKAAHEALEQARTEAKADTVVQYLATHTPAECGRYVQDNVVDLPSAKAFLKSVAMVLSVLARKELR